MGKLLNVNIIFKWIVQIRELKSKAVKLKLHTLLGNIQK